MTEIKVLFMGTPEFAETILTSLIEAKYSVVAAYTQPDKPIGRDQEVVKSPVKVFAETHSIPVEQPSTLLGDDVTKKLHAYAPDIIIVAAYGKILPESMLGIPRYGCINVHASLLPRWRGASPIQNALLAGDKETGVSIMLMDRGMDTGPVVRQTTVPILPEDTTETLLPRIADEGSTLLLSLLPQWIEKKIEPTAQDETHATVCQLIEREDGKIFWSEEAETIYNKYRAFTPWPGIFCFWKKDASLLRLKLLVISLQKQNPETKYPMGQVFEIGEGIGVQTSRGIILLREIQLEGKTSVSITEFVRGYPDFVGAILE